MRGFTLFFALLAASLALAIGLAILDITLRELELSSTVAQSEYAFYAADSGAECALYWDSKYNGTGSVFATSSQSIAPPSGTVFCNNQDIVAAGTPPSPIVAPPTGWRAWTVTTSAASATTTFTLSFLPSQTYCVQVTVTKVGNPPATTVTSDGLNTCQGVGVQVERELRVSY